MTMLLAVEHRWTCPACPATDVTRETGPHTRMHICSGLGGLTVPMVPAGTKAKVETVERGDYIRDELVTIDGNGRPVMAAVVTRDDGIDVAVYAPCATAGGD